MIILLDCDGVVADWTGAVAKVIEEVTGKPMDRTKWFEQRELPKPERNQVMARISGKGFCRTFDILPGAIEGVEWMRSRGHYVHFVTSLWDCPTWVYDRNVWLRNTGFAPRAPSGVTYTKDKFMVRGHVFVDDKPSNVEEWAKANPVDAALLFDQPWNKEASATRVTDWVNLRAFVKWKEGFV